MSKLTIKGNGKGHGLKELSIDGVEIPLKYLSSFNFDSNTPDGLSTLTLNYFVTDVDVIDIDNLGEVKVTKFKE